VLTPKDWQKIKIDFYNGIIPKDICEKYPELGLKPKQISDKAYRQKWEKLTNDDVNQIIEQAKTDVKADFQGQITEIIEKKIDRTLRQLDLASLLAAKIEDALKSNFKKVIDKEGNVDYVEYDIKDLKAIGSALLDLQKIERIGEDLDKNDKLKDPQGGTIGDLVDAIKESAKIHGME
jgi:hypothetical protein